MRLPSMRYASRIDKRKQVQFGGLAHYAGAQDGELWDMKNLTSDLAPVLSVRPARALRKKLEKATGLFGWKGLCWTVEDKLYHEGVLRNPLLPLDPDTKKTFAALGAYIVILPDKVWYNVDTFECGRIEASWHGDRYSLRDGTLYGQPAAANTIRCEGAQWQELFRPGDALTIEGLPTGDTTLIVREVADGELRFYENSFQVGDMNEEITIRRIMPDMDHLCQAENRLWGCKGDTIYASKLGDIFNWNVYDGLDTDSFTTDTGSEGDFTGCITYRGYPTFFKENAIYKVYGAVPSQFSVDGVAALGLKTGCAGTLAVVGEALIYLNRNGFVEWYGGQPQLISGAFGRMLVREAVSGSTGLKYYTSLKTVEGDWGMYVYDIRQGVWHKEDDTQATHFATRDFGLYFLNAKGEIWRIARPTDELEETSPEGPLEWFAEFGDFTDLDPNKKGVGKLQLRLELDAGATAQAWIQFDSDGVWRPVGGQLGEAVKRSYYLPIVPRRADHYRLKLTGIGGCRVYSLVREQYSGSEARSRKGEV